MGLTLVDSCYSAGKQKSASEESNFDAIDTVNYLQTASDLLKYQQ